MNICYMPGIILDVFTWIIILNLPNNWDLGIFILILWKKKLNLRKPSNLSKVTQLAIDRAGIKIQVHLMPLSVCFSLFIWSPRLNHGVSRNITSDHQLEGRNYFIVLSFAQRRFPFSELDRLPPSPCWKEFFLKAAQDTVGQQF